MGLRVALTGGPHHGPGVLKHGDKKGVNERRGEEILGGTKKIGTLPPPLACAESVSRRGWGGLGIKIASVAGPYTNVPPRESLFRGEGCRDVARPRCGCGEGPWATEDGQQTAEKGEESRFLQWRIFVGVVLVWGGSSP